MSDFRSTLYSYNYYLPNGLFEHLTVPTGIDKDVLIQIILKECGEMTPVWTDPNFMAEMIGVWSTKWEKTFEKWYHAYTFEYEPLYNYDRYEEVSETNSNELSSTDTGSVTNTRTAYDSNTYQPHDKSDTTGATSSDSAGEFSRDAHMYGNIGVTTSQQMLEAEYNIAKWNIYDQIKDLFMQEFCIMIY